MSSIHTHSFAMVPYVDTLTGERVSYAFGQFDAEYASRSGWWFERRGQGQVEDALIALVAGRAEGTYPEGDLEVTVTRKRILVRGPLAGQHVEGPLRIWIGVRPLPGSEFARLCATPRVAA